MRRSIAMIAVTLSLFTAVSSAQAQMRNDLALHAMFGGVAGVLGALTREAIDNAKQRPAYAGSPYVSAPASPAYTGYFPSEDRSGVLYNKPCSTFDTTTGRLLPCQMAVAYDTPVYEPNVVVRTRPARRHHYHRVHSRNYYAKPVNK